MASLMIVTMIILHFFLWWVVSARLSWSAHQYLVLWRPVYGSFQCISPCFTFHETSPSLLHIILFLKSPSLCSLRDFPLMLLFFSLPLTLRTSGDILSQQGLTLAFTFINQSKVIKNIQKKKSTIVWTWNVSDIWSLTRWRTAPGRFWGKERWIIILW